jgi:choline dehydrogenase-like flavoprotein
MRAQPRARRDGVQGTSVALDFVADGSVFPTSAGYNPTLTILANAYRVADCFVGEVKRRSL